MCFCPTQTGQTPDPAKKVLYVPLADPESILDLSHLIDQKRSPESEDTNILKHVEQQSANPGILLNTRVSDQRIQDDLLQKEELIKFVLVTLI